MRMKNFAKVGLSIMLIFSVTCLSGCEVVSFFSEPFNDVIDNILSFFPGNLIPGDEGDMDIGGGIALYENGRINLEVISPYRNQDLRNTRVDFKVRVTGQEAAGTVCASAPRFGIECSCPTFDTGEYDEHIVNFGEVSSSGDFNELPDTSIIGVWGYSEVESNAAVFTACYKDPERFDDGCRIIRSDGNPVSLPIRGRTSTVSVKEVHEEFLAGSSSSVNNIRFILKLEKERGLWLYTGGACGDEATQGSVAVTLIGPKLGTLFCGNYDFMGGTNELDVVCPVTSIPLEGEGGTILDPDYTEPVVVRLEYPFRTSNAISVKV